MKQFTFLINGVEVRPIADPESNLSDVIRRQLRLTGTKVGCGQGVCGACNVIIDGKLVRSCTLKMKRLAEGAQITTIEGIGKPGHLHPLQESWIYHGGAQCGFCSPGFIVSAKALLDSNPNPSREEVRDWFQKHKNACRCTGYKPLVDAVMDAAKVLRGEMDIEKLRFKLSDGNKIWGSRYPRPTGIAKVTGTLDYGADLGLKMPEGTLHMALVQAEVSHGIIKNIDTSEAEKMPGVYKVVTHKDVKGKNRITGVITFPTNKGDGWDRPILCDNKIFQFGDAIAIVCADSVCNAKAAAKKVKVDIDVLPAYMDAYSAKAPDAIEIHPGTPNNYFVQKIVKGEDTEPIFNSADAVVEDNFYVGRQPHMPIEPDVGFAFVDDKGELIIHSKSIGVHLHKAMIAPGIGLPNDKIHIVQNPAGGTFGYKFSPTMEALVAVAALATERPVLLVYDYFQQMSYTGKRSPFFINMRFAANKEGKLLAMETDFDVDHGPYSEFGDLLTLRGTQFMGAGYNIPNIRGEGRTICTNHAWGSAFRGYGSPQAEFASEVLMDELAEKLGIDPLEIRYKNAYREGSTTPTGQVPEVFSIPAMLDILRPLYHQALENAKANSTLEHKKGVGISVGVYGSGLDGPDGAAADVQMNPDGTVTVITTWGDHGQGADSGIIGVAHETLLPMGIKPEQIKFAWSDTRSPDAGPAGGSRSQVMAGGAIKAACENMLEAIKKDNGGYFTYEELSAANKPTRFSGKYGVPGISCDENSQGSPFMVYMYGVFMAEVDVELKTGKTTIDKMTAISDIGRINNQLVVDGQMWGGLAQGIGLALTEDYEDIKKHSTLVGAGFPYIKNIPDNMELIYVQDFPREFGPFGSAGAGELSLTSPHAAIINAIYNACGARITRLPALPEKVLEALNNK